MLRSLQLLALCALLCGSASIGASECCAPITLEVSARSLDAGELGLKIKLSNVGKQPLRFSMGSGPWAGAGQIRLVAIKLPAAVAIPNELRAMVDPALGTIELQPGESREYLVPLRQLYPEFNDELKTEAGAEYVLFWTYQLNSASTQSERLGGWLTIPRKK